MVRTWVTAVSANSSVAGRTNGAGRKKAPHREREALRKLKSLWLTWRTAGRAPVRAYFACVRASSISSHAHCLSTSAWKAAITSGCFLRCLKRPCESTHSETGFAVAGR